jgi:hypothetical protein
MDPLTPTSQRHLAAILLIGGFLFLPGCGRKMAKLHEAENTAAGAIQRSLVLYEGLYAGVTITNLHQVFDGATRLDQWHIMHPARLETDFRKFGKYAGFTNSFYEKYVRVPSGVSNRAFPKDAMFMNAQPVPDYDGGYGRFVIWREGPQDYRNNWAPESQIQEAFQRAGVPIPQVTPMPKPPRPGGSPYPDHSLGTRTVLFFKDLSGDYGPGRALWFPFMLICLGVPLIISVVLFVWIFRRSRR